MSHRFEHEDQDRRDRARAHLARVRDRSAERRVVWKRRAEPERPPTQKASRRELGGVLLVSIVAGLLLGDGWLVFVRDLVGSQPAPLTRIAIHGTKRLSAESVAEATGVAPGTPLAALDEAQIEQTLTRHGWIREAHAKRLPGGSLVVSVIERVPSATTWLGEPARPFAVDASGAVFAPADSPEEVLPRLVPAQPASLGDENPQLAHAIELNTQLLALGLATASEIGIDPGAEGFTLRLPGLDTEFVLGKEDLSERLSRLSRLLAQRPAEVAGAARVDLRFEDQVVLQKGAAREGSLHKAASRGHAAPPETQHSG